MYFICLPILLIQARCVCVDMQFMFWDYGPVICILIDTVSTTWLFVKVTCCLLKAGLVWMFQLLFLKVRGRFWVVRDDRFHRKLHCVWWTKIILKCKFYLCKFVVCFGWKDILRTFDNLIMRCGDIHSLSESLHTV